MKMADIRLQEHRSLIICLFKQHFSEEEIVDELCNVGVETTFLEILQCLEIWHVIPCPSPVYSNDTDTETTSDLQPRTSSLRLGVTCHHGESSHASTISPAVIPYDETPTERYRQDWQSHEELALGFLVSGDERARRRGLAIDNSTINGMSPHDSKFEDEVRQKIKTLRRGNICRRQGNVSGTSRVQKCIRYNNRTVGAKKSPKQKSPHRIRDVTT